MTAAILAISGIEIGSTLMWMGIGVVCAIVAAMFAGGKRMLPYDIIVGVVASLAGGWATGVVMGDNSRLAFIICTLAALFVCGISLLVYNRLMRRNDA